MKKLSGLHLILLVVFGVFVCGCRDNPYGVSKVTGVVIYENKPVKGASVTFVPQQKENFSASGMTNEKGEFLLTTAGAEGGSGAQPGEYAVAIRKVGLPDDMQISSPGGSAMIGTGTNRQQIPDVARMQTDQLPVQYKSTETSGLQAVVENKGKNHFVFELKK